MSASEEYKGLEEYKDLTSNNKFVSLRYPDLKEHGSLRKLLQSHLDAIGSTLEARGQDTTSDGQCGCWAAVKSGARLSQITVAVGERLFVFDLWERGVHLGQVGTPCPLEMVQVLDAWIASNISPRELKQRFPFVEVNSCADAYVAGAAVYVESKWAQLHERVEQDQFFLSVLAPVVRLARSHPILGRLMPFTSLNRLCFSRCTGYPFLVPCPIIVPITRPNEMTSSGIETQYEVQDHNGEKLIRGNAATVINYVVNCLPSDCGPAFHGSAEEE